MKKIILLSIFAFFAVNIFAQPYADFSGIRIFVNPGHGGHDGDDRHMVFTEFWESEGNLSKGLQLRTLLCPVQLILPKTICHFQPSAPCQMSPMLISSFLYIVMVLTDSEINL